MSKAYWRPIGGLRATTVPRQLSHVPPSSNQQPRRWIMERPYPPTDDLEQNEQEREPLRLSDDESNILLSSASMREGMHLASLVEKKRMWWRNAIINSLFIASWFFFSTLLSLYNKWMFSPTKLGFPAPVFVTMMHMWIQFSLAATLRAIWPKRFKPAHNPQPKDYGKKVVPTAMATGLDIGLSNLSLKTITLSFFTMCKSSSLIFVLIFAFAFGLESFSWRLVGVIFLIFSGVLLMVATQTHFVFEGFILVISASALGGLRWSLTQVLLKDKKMGLDNPAATIFWLAPSMGATLAVVSMSLERWPTIFRSQFFDGVLKTVETVSYLTLPGVIAFCMVLSEFYIILRTGVVPMSIAGIAKEVSTIMISSWYFGDDITVVNSIGVAITVCGIGLFTHHKYRKSLESTVPLDAHGKPIFDEGEMMTSTDNAGYGAQDEETIRLTSTHDGDLDNEEGPRNSDDTADERQSAAGHRWEAGQSGSARDGEAGEARPGGRNG